jgi:potassium-dependent mechanosensitive channel
MQRLSPFVLLSILILLSSACPALGQQPSASPARSTPTATPIPLIAVPAEERSTIASLQEIGAGLTKDESSVTDFAGRLSKLTSEIDTRIGEDNKLLAGTPFLDILYQLESIWQNFSDSLSALDRALADRAASLAKAHSHLDQFNEIWQVTLQSARQSKAPQSVLDSFQHIIDSISGTRQTTESVLNKLLTTQGDLSEQQARVRTILSSIKQSQTRAFESLLVRDGPPIWSGKTNLGTEWKEQSGVSFSAQSGASIAFIKRFPFAFLVQPFLIVVIAATLRLMRRRLRGLMEEKPDLERAFPIVDLPVSTALVLSLLILLSIIPQAPRLLLAILGVISLIPLLLILRKLLLPNSYPILYAMVVLALLGELRLVTASLPGSSRLLYLFQTFGGSCFLIWLLRRWHLPTAAAETHGRLWRNIRSIAKIGLILLPVAFLANILGYIQLSNLLGQIFLRSAFVAAMVYVAIRIVEGFIIIALQVRPLGTLRFVSLHRPLLQRRIFRALGLLGFLYWLSVSLNFFGLLAPLREVTKAALNATIVIGSISISLDRILAFVIAVWASFLVSRFIRFLLEADFYDHFHLAPGVPYAISTMLHYAILLLGFFIALGALGIDLTKITILAGAFSVGIGFGLQNVINNFVSGLILLFERPIKIGDTIEVGGIIGDVRRIGIRASVIRTGDGSEVILPNGSLISSQVTNWTLSDVLRALEVSVNVAESADPQRVIELLKATAVNLPGVVKQPPPQVHIANFTANAVTFQLRAWTDQHQTLAQLRSDLSLAVMADLAREKIAIV